MPTALVPCVVLRRVRFVHNTQTLGSQRRRNMRCLIACHLEMIRSLLFKEVIGRGPPPRWRLVFLFYFRSYLLNRQVYPGKYSVQSFQIRVAQRTIYTSPEFPAFNTNILHFSFPFVYFTGSPCRSGSSPLHFKTDEPFKHSLFPHYVPVVQPFFLQLSIFSFTESL
jgi:hypothetical protein